MRRWVLSLLLCGALGAAAQSLPTTRLVVQTQAQVPDLVCAAPPQRPSGPPADPQPLQPPDEAQVRAQLQQAPSLEAGLPVQPLAGRWLSARQEGLLRVALWGDSHLAAGFFTSELGRLLQLDAGQVQPRWLPASMGRPGVRLPLRKSCLGGAWRHEPAHVDPRWAVGVGPAMVSMSSDEPGASLAWDLRLADGRAERRQVRLFYQQTDTPVRLALRVDEGEPQTLTLQGPEGPAVLEIEGDGPLSLLRLTLLEGRWRWHALEMPLTGAARLQLDVFGYPGATVAGWKHAAAQAPSTWWGDDDHDLVVLAFGTNEGNVQPFDAAAYGQTLRAAVAAWRARHPQAACLLIGPGDRGVLVRRAARKGRKPTPTGVDLLRFTRIHAEINRLQHRVAEEHGCRFWSMMQAMGGAGGAYRWQSRQPPWMARDLTHFTVAGYQQLARQWATDMGWQPEVLDVPAFSAPR